jgi:putative PIN family toxin of toxin-antitoxin system
MLLRVVLDTTVLISAIRSRNGAAARLIQMAIQRQFALLMDVSLSLEYREVALRSEHATISHFTEDEILRLISILENLAMPVKITEPHRPLCVDPGDDHILELAINGKADVIVTANLRHLQEPALKHNIQAMDARTFLSRIETGGSHADTGEPTHN